MTINGYARLVGYRREARTSSPTSSKASTSVEDRIFTFKIREGHKWSDGSPLTSEDFRYMLGRRLAQRGSVAGRARAGAAGRRQAAGVRGRRRADRALHLGRAEPGFPASARRRAAAEPGAAGRLSEAVPQEVPGRGQARRADRRRTRPRTGRRCTSRMARQYRPENPDLPTLDPWRNTTKPPAEQFVFERNPFFHRVDENGLQLPYIDQFMLNVSSSSIIPAKTGAGESDLQCTGIDFTDYTFLKDAEKRYPVKVSLWKRTQGSRARAAAQPQLPPTRSGGRCCSDVRVRRALSLAIDRREINMAVFYGLAQGKRRHGAAGKPALQAGISPRPGSPTIPTRPMRCSTRSASQSATTTASACCPTAARRRSSSRRPAKARWRPTCSNWSPITGARSASRCSSAPRSATSSAAAPSAARS